MKTKKTKQGFTIVELLLAMVAFAIMILAVGLMLIYGWLGWRKSTQSVNMQRDAVLAMQQIAREIRVSNVTEITDDSAGIYFTPSSTPTVRTNSVNILASDIPVFPGVNIEPDSFYVTYLTNNAVTVSFTLFTDGDYDRNDYQITVNTRN
jgi:type II secretory pathway pseudopilin PulG